MAAGEYWIVTADATYNRQEGRVTVIRGDEVVAELSPFATTAGPVVNGVQYGVSFGSSVAVSTEGLVVVGCADDANEAGSVFLYQMSRGGAATPLARITNPDEGAGSGHREFGKSAIFIDDDSMVLVTSFVGVYIYEVMASTMVLRVRLLAAPGENVLAAAASFDVLAMAHSNVVDLYHRVASYSVSEAIRDRLKAPDAFAGADDVGKAFGYALAFYDNILAVGHPSADNGAGAVHIYRPNAQSRYTYDTTLQAEPMSGSGSRLGTTLAFENRGAVLAGGNSEGSANPGAWLFSPVESVYSSGAWRQRLLPIRHSGFGVLVAIGAYSDLTIVGNLHSMAYDPCGVRLNPGGGSSPSNYETIGMFTEGPTEGVTAAPGSGGDGKAKGVAGIAIGSVLAVVLAVGAVLLLVRRRLRRTAVKMSSGDMAFSNPAFGANVQEDGQVDVEAEADGDYGALFEGAEGEGADEDEESEA